MTPEELEIAKNECSDLKESDKAVIIVRLYYDDSTSVSTFGRPEWVGKLRKQLLNLLQ